MMYIIVYIDNAKNRSSIFGKAHYSTVVGLTMAYVTAVVQSLPQMDTAVQHLTV